MLDDEGGKGGGGESRSSFAQSKLVVSQFTGNKIGISHNFVN